MMTCTGCGFDAEQFCEGYCVDCQRDRQRALDLHNAQFDRWERLTDSQRRDEIRRAGAAA